MNIHRNHLVYLLLISTVVIAAFGATRVSNDALKISFFAGAYAAILAIHEFVLYKSLSKEGYIVIINLVRYAYILATYLFLLAIIITPSHVKPILLFCYPLLLVIALQFAAWTFCRKFAQKEKAGFLIFMTMLSSTIQGILLAIVAIVFFKVQTLSICSKIWK